MQPQHKLDPKKRKTPPNFGVAKDGKTCGSCRYFDGRGTCTKYHYPAKVFNTCSAYAPRTSGHDQPGSGAPSVPAAADGAQPARLVIDGSETAGA